MKIKNKKTIQGKKSLSLPANTLVYVILSILVLLIVLGLIFLLKPEKTVDNVACHESIVYRHSLREAGNNFIDPEKIPLQCQTEKICFRAGSWLQRVINSKEKGIINKLKEISPTCKDYKGLDGVTIIDIKETDPDKAKLEIISYIADSMAECWSTVGEGYLDYYGKTLTDTTYCSPCARIEFHSSVQDILNINSISYKDLYKFMETTYVPTKQITYLKYLYDRQSLSTLRNDILELAAMQKSNTGGEMTGNKIDIFKNNPGTADIFNMSINTSKEYMIITTIGKGGWLGNIAFAAGGAAAVIGAAAFTFGTGGLGGVLILAGAGGAGGSFLYTSNFEKETVKTSPALIVTDDKDEELKALKCDKYEWIP